MRKYRNFFILLFILFALVVSFRISLRQMQIPHINQKFDISQDVDAIRGFIEWFGVLYGLILAFILMEAWLNFNRVEEEIDKEADALQMLDWTARLLGKDRHLPVTQVIQNYAHEILKTRGVKGNDEQLRMLLQSLYIHVGELIKENQNVAMSLELVRLLNEVLDTHGDRRQHAKTKIPSALWGTLLLTTVIWLIAYLGMGTHQPLIGYMITGSATLSVVSILLIIRDLLKPYQGAIRVNFQSFQDLIDNLAQWPTMRPS